MVCLSIADLQPADDYAVLTLNKPVNIPGKLWYAFTCPALPVDLLYDM